MTDRKLFGTNTLVDEFTKNLTNIETFDGGWSTKYIDNLTGHEWVKYVVDERGFFVNLIFGSPLPTTEDLLNIAFHTNHLDEIYAAAARLSIEEQANKIEFRKKLIDRLITFEILNLEKIEKDRIKTIILASELTDRLNRREIVGKHYSEIQANAEFFNNVADIAHNILKQL